jgi:hypothetical protein
MSIRSVSKRIFTSRWFISGATLVALYSLTGFFLLPYLAKRYLDQYVERRLDHRLVLAELRSNPFTFTVEAKQLGITDKNGSPITNLAFFSADFDPLSSVGQPRLDLFVYQNDRSAPARGVEARGRIESLGGAERLERR